jgi:hypothetical protein
LAPTLAENACQPACRKGCLQVEATGIGIEIENFAGKVETRTIFDCIVWESISARLIPLK